MGEQDRCEHGSLRGQCETCAAWGSAIYNQRRADQAERELAEEHRLLCNLLATVHRDGGHRVGAVGIARATEEAITLSVARIQAVTEVFPGVDGKSTVEE